MRVVESSLDLEDNVREQFKQFDKIKFRLFLQEDLFCTG